MPNHNSETAKLQTTILSGTVPSRSPITPKSEVREKVEVEMTEQRSFISKVQEGCTNSLIKGVCYGTLLIGTIVGCVVGHWYHYNQQAEHSAGHLEANSTTTHGFVEMLGNVTATLLGVEMEHSSNDSTLFM